MMIFIEPSSRVESPIRRTGTAKRRHRMTGPRWLPMTNTSHEPEEHRPQKPVRIILPRAVCTTPGRCCSCRSRPSVFRGRAGAEGRGSVRRSRRCRAQPDRIRQVPDTSTRWVCRARPGRQPLRSQQDRDDTAHHPLGQWHEQFLVGGVVHSERWHDIHCRMSKPGAKTRPTIEAKPRGNGPPPAPPSTCLAAPYSSPARGVSGVESEPPRNVFSAF